MNVDAEIMHAEWLIWLRIEASLAIGNAEIDRTIARHRAWLRYWPDPVPNGRSAGQILRHMRKA